jgi:hypothetical protein
MNWRLVAISVLESALTAFVDCLKVSGYVLLALLLYWLISRTGAAPWPCPNDFLYGVAVGSFLAIRSARLRFDHWRARVEQRKAVA